MNMIDRARFVLFGDLPGRKAVARTIENPLARFILAALGMGRQAIWTPKRYDQLSEAGYQNCMTVYACVNQVARAAAGIEWKAMRGEKDDPKSPLLSLLARPNENEGKRGFMAKRFSYFLLAGNTYILVGRIGNQPPQALWLCRPDRITILPGTGGSLVGGYVYTVNGREQKLEFGQILHSRLFHPTNDFYGLSPLEVAARGVDVINMSSEWNMRLLQNDMKPPGVLSTEGKLDDARYARLKALMKAEWQGYENAASPLLLEGGLKWTSTAMLPKDLDWLNSTKLTKRDICTVFNVDPCLIGDAEYATYSNKQEARKGLYLETVLPLMEEFRDDLNNWLCPMFGPDVHLEIAKDKIEVLQEEREKKFAYIENCSVMRIDEKRAALGLDPIGGPAGEVILVPLGKIPLEAAVEPEPEPEPDPDEDPDNKPPVEEDPDQDEDEAAKASRKALGRQKALPLAKSFWAAPERKERLWRAFEGRVKAREKSFEQIAKGYLKRQAETAKQRAAAASSLGVLSAADLLDLKAETKKYAKDFWPWYRDHFIRAGNAGMKASKGELFNDAEFKADDPTSWVFEMTSEQEQLLREMVFESGTEVNKTALEEIYKVIKDANAGNLTVDEFAQQIYEKLSDFSPWRARLWARTESAKVDNFGQVQGYKETEFVEKKGWMCSFVPESRETHEAADGQEVLLDEDFVVGGARLAYPGDPAGDPGDVCNCLCGTYPVVGEPS